MVILGLHIHHRGREQRFGKLSRLVAQSIIAGSHPSCRLDVLYGHEHLCYCELYPKYAIEKGTCDQGAWIEQADKQHEGEYGLAQAIHRKHAQRSEAYIPLISSSTPEQSLKRKLTSVCQARQQEAYLSKVHRRRKAEYQGVSYARIFIMASKGTVPLIEASSV